MTLKQTHFELGLLISHVFFTSFFKYLTPQIRGGAWVICLYRVGDDRSQEEFCMGVVKMSTFIFFSLQIHFHLSEHHKFEILEDVSFRVT